MANVLELNRACIRLVDCTTVYTEEGVLTKISQRIRQSVPQRAQWMRRWRTRATFWMGAVAVGGVAVGFAMASDWAIHVHAAFAGHHAIVALLVLPPALAAIAWLAETLAPGSRGSGIPQVIAALNSEPGATRLALLSMKIATAKLILTVLALLSGASIGREGPTVHVGAAVMDVAGRLGRFPIEYVRRGLVLAGSAAGLAAAFNTPIAGIVFAVEELARSFEERTTGTLLTAVVLAGVVSLSLLGNYTYFGQATAHLQNYKAWWAVPLCGFGGGLIGGLFSRVLIQTQRYIRPYQIRRPVLCALGFGIVVAIAALATSGATYGTGYDQARALIDGSAPSNLSFPMFKALATLASYLTGIPGGLFSPTLSTGAALGSEFARLVPEVPLDAMVVLGMAGYFTGVIQSPLTGAVIIMEMVGDHALILPMLATCFLAMIASQRVCPEPIYHALAKGFV